MKNQKNIYILTGVFVVLVVIAYLLTAERGTKTTTSKLDEKIFVIDSASVDKLEIERNGARVVLQKMGGKWNLTAPVNYSATDKFVNDAIWTLKNYKISSKVSENPSNRDKFGFSDTNFTKVSVYQNGNSAGQFIIGNAGPGNAQAYLKKVDGSEIYLADDFVWNYLVKTDLTDWRDKVILSVPKGAIKSIDFITKDENYSVIVDSLGKFFIGKDTVSAAALDGVLNLLQNYSTQGFKDTVLTGAGSPNYYMRINTGPVTELKFYRYMDTESSKRCLLQVTGNTQIFEMDENYVKQLFKTKKELLGKN
ncbi:MAG: DUF4340 domain-containing protein [Bacteroidetes bacterium]|nr:DUF4340 domain-containing protein [Bacteroidota bacterium]